MIPTQFHFDQLAGRIEAAYRRRHSKWVGTGLTPGVWTAAAGRLSGITAVSPNLPIDPELYVAVQNYKPFRRDPWRELTQEESARRYRSSVRKIVKQLKAELAGELDWSNQLLNTGRSIDDVITVAKSRVSAITKLALCVRHNREDLAAIVRPDAEAQQLACPLYLFACRNLMPDVTQEVPRDKHLSILGITGHSDSFAWN